MKRVKLKSDDRLCSGIRRTFSNSS